VTQTPRHRRCLLAFVVAINLAREYERLAGLSKDQPE
jgi:hypothetical protein